MLIVKWGSTRMYCINLSLLEFPGCGWRTIMLVALMHSFSHDGQRGMCLTHQSGDRNLRATVWTWEMSSYSSKFQRECWDIVQCCSILTFYNCRNDTKYTALHHGIRQQLKRICLVNCIWARDHELNSDLKLRPTYFCCMQTLCNDTKLNW